MQSADPTPTPPVALSGRTLPDAGAVVAHAATGVRLVMSWDACADSPAELRHQQVTPNHILYEAGGEPVIGDGAPAHDEGFLDVALEDVAAYLTPAQLEQVTREFGSPEAWARRQQPGLIGAANTIVIDGESGYFPPGARRGRLVYEERAADRHVITAECAEFFRPRYELTRARRTFSLSSDGIAWIVDDYRAARKHRFDWQAYLRRGCLLSNDGASLRVRSGVGGGTVLATLGWSRHAAPVGLHRFPSYPAATTEGPLPWPDAGSERLRLRMAVNAPFAVCIVPGDAVHLAVRSEPRNGWRAEWMGGSDEFRLPGEAIAE